ncbi:hypothetical protein BJP36_35525 [Moorena producens JHB]|uniref:Uncharacterized protein n=1 Tax=Moorena producens (strain JHB) TaxID=1454205 RepID=A0A9Q9STK7_MOOP1|nr:hypothetical protein [Moorena producens]WAN69403.1 hypothetical protein BJP36_35525 [Moorena producens JHB]
MLISLGNRQEAIGNSKEGFKRCSAAKGGSPHERLHQDTARFFITYLYSVSFFFPSCLLPIAYCLLPLTSYLLPLTSYLLPLTSYLLPIAYCLLPIAYCLLPIASYLLPLTYCLLPTPYSLLPTPFIIVLIND